MSYAHPCSKLRNLKSVLKVWNKEQFGDVHQNVKQALQHLNDVHSQMQKIGYNDELVVQEQNAHTELNKALLFKEQFWHEETRVN